MRRPTGLDTVSNDMHELRMDSEQVYEVIHMEGDQKEGQYTITTASTGPGPRRTISYTTDKVVGNGSFGVVFQAKCVETGEVVAIKKVLQDKRFKNRELQIMQVKLSLYKL